MFNYPCPGTRNRGNWSIYIQETWACLYKSILYDILYIRFITNQQQCCFFRTIDFVIPITVYLVVIQPSESYPSLPWVETKCENFKLQCTKGL